MDAELNLSLAYDYMQRLSDKKFVNFKNLMKIVVKVGSRLCPDQLQVSPRYSPTQSLSQIQEVWTCCIFSIIHEPLVTAQQQQRSLAGPIGIVCAFYLDGKNALLIKARAAKERVENSVHLLLRTKNQLMSENNSNSTFRFSYTLLSDHRSLG